MFSRRFFVNSSSGDALVNVRCWNSQPTASGRVPPIANGGAHPPCRSLLSDRGRPTPVSRRRYQIGDNQRKFRSFKAQRRVHFLTSASDRVAGRSLSSSPYNALSDTSSPSIQRSRNSPSRTNPSRSRRRAETTLRGSISPSIRRKFSEPNACSISAVIGTCKLIHRRH